MTGTQLHICAFCGFGAFFCNFWPLRNALQKIHRKSTEKNAKIEVLGLPKPSQNPPKMPPKSAAPLAAPGVLNPICILPSETLLLHA